MKDVIEKVICATVITFGIISLPSLFLAWYKPKKRLKVPGNYAQWKPVGRLGEIILYPLKSGVGISVERALCTQIGLSEIPSENNKKFLLRDRHFMLFREDTGEMISALTLHNTLKISLKAVGCHKHSDQSCDCQPSVMLSYPDVQDIRINLPEPNQKTTRMWRKEAVIGWDCGDEVSKWLTNILRGSSNTDRAIRLAYWPDTGDNRRHLVETYKELYNDKVFAGVTNDDSGAFSDITSYMLMSSTCMTELNTRLAEKGREPIPVSQFRPNFFVETTEPPFTDLNWKWVKINNTMFKFVKGCKRCSLTTYTCNGTKLPNNEPLTTLNSICAAKTEVPIKESPMMGIHLGLASRESVVSVGDPVYVITST